MDSYSFGILSGYIVGIGVLSLLASLLTGPILRFVARSMTKLNYSFRESVLATFCGSVSTFAIISLSSEFELISPRTALIVFGLICAACFLIVWKVLNELEQPKVTFVRAALLGMGPLAAL